MEPTQIEMDESDNAIQESLATEDIFICDLINTIPSSYYFDQETKELLADSKHDSTNKKMLQVAGKRKGKLIRDEVKHKFAKLDPDQNKSVTETIILLHANTNNIKTNMNVNNNTLSYQNLQKRLQDKMEEIQKNKIKGIPDSEVSEEQLAKRTKRRLNRQRAKEKKLNAKKDREPYNRPKQNFNHSGKKPRENGELSSEKPIYNSEGKMVFSKFDFCNSTSRKKPGKDFKGMLNKVKKEQEKMKTIAATDQDKAKKMEEKKAWKSAFQKVEGVKIKDDPELLKKSLKKKEQIKRKSEKQWKKREGNVEKLKTDKQTKRKENIQKRITDKKNRKLKKAVKKGRMIPGFS